MRPKSYLDGQMLIAMPSIGDSRFQRSLIYLCAHSSSGAMGLIVNKPAPLMFFSDIVRQLPLSSDTDFSAIPLSALNMPVLFGGPVDQNRGFVLHSNDYFTEGASMSVANNICLTATVEVLEAIVRGEGPAKVMLALGYSGWTSGQLEDEIKHNGWLTCDADDELLFGTSQEAKYTQALAKIGVDLAMISAEAGHS